RAKRRYCRSCRCHFQEFSSRFHALDGIKESKVIPIPSYHYKCQHANKTSFDEAAGSSKSFFIVVSEDVGFHNAKGCGGVNEPDIVARPAFRDKANMCDLVLFPSCRKEHKFARPKLVKLHFLAHFTLIHRSSRQGYVNGTKGVQQQSGTVHPRSCGTTILVWRTQIGAGSLDYFFCTGVRFRDLRM